MVGQTEQPEKVMAGKDKKHVFRWNIFIGIGVLPVLLLALLFSCKPVETRNEVELDENTRCPPGQWAIDTNNYYAYRHDCDPYASTHFTVYSDE